MARDVFRRGSMSNESRQRIDDWTVFISNYGFHNLWLCFQDLRANGKSTFTLDIDRESFHALALAMIQTDREVAIKAFGAALQADPVKIGKQDHWSPLTAAA